MIDRTTMHVGPLGAAIDVLRAEALSATASSAFIVRQLELNNLVANSFLERIRPYPDDADPAEVAVGLIADLGWEARRFAIDERGWFLPIAIYWRCASTAGSPSGPAKRPSSRKTAAARCPG